MATVSTVLVAYAVNADGYPVHKAELNDGGIWITNQSMGAVGRQNVPVAQIDGRIFDGTPFQESTSLDVLQNDSAVLSVDAGNHTLMPVDVAMATGLEEQKVTVGGDQTSFGGTSIAVVDSVTGKIWATTVDPTVGVSSIAELGSEAKPFAVAGKDAVGTVGSDGTVYAASAASAKLTTLRPQAGGLGKPETSGLPDAPSDGYTAITAVGDHPVLLDSAGNLSSGGERLAYVGEGAVLQQPGPDSDEVLVATSEALVAVALDGGKTRALAKAGGEGAAAPVRLANGCAFAAWGVTGLGTLVSECGAGKARSAQFELDKAGDAELVFRVNRNQVVLNDQANGTVWTVTGAKPEKISNWEAFQPQQEQKDDKDDHQVESENTQPPDAENDELGARDGRTTVLHVLDNDKVATGGILSIVDVKGPSREGVDVQIAPDRQSLLATVDEGVQGTVGFTYTIDDGTKDKTAQDDGEVKLTVKADNGSGKPELRESPPERAYSVTAGGVLEIAATPDWRDKDYGDPIVVEGLKTSGDADVSITSAGLVRFEAPARSKGGVQTVTYSVTTGGAPANGALRVRVLKPGRDTVAPQAEPDVASGEVGGVILVRPLDNDVPGADASDAAAELSIAGRVAPQGGLSVDTDIETGVVRIRAPRAGTYFLSYRAGFGAADRDENQIRVDVLPASAASNKPIATPDTTAVHGLSPMTVDVLANDYDAKGRMLMVTNARPSKPDSDLEVAVIDGRWVRVNATDAAMDPQSQSITYTISNGEATADGSVNVTQRGALAGAQNAPVTQPDLVTVRAGDTAAIPVLDNDSTPSGDPVGLVLDPSFEPAGELRVLPEAGSGHAYVAGRQVRFVAPDTVNGPTDVDVQYVVENTGDPTAATAVGSIKVHITPPPGKTNPNQAPTPRQLDGRVVQGDVLTLKLPSTGLDPDGDSVSVVGVDTAPLLGRVLAYGANSISYQAYPDVQGTDEFTYTVTDRYGETATGQARVGVVEPGAPQAPLAVDDTLFADPSRKVDVDVLANDLRTPGTKLTILPLDAGAPVGTKLRSQTGPVVMEAPDHGTSSRVVYTVTNGLAESRGVVTIKGRKGFNNPPVVGDLYATPEAGATSVEVDVLGAAYDVDGPESDLALDSVTDGATIKGGKVTVPITATAQVLAYRVIDGDDAAAAAAIYVPARPTGTPYLKPGAVIRMDPDSTKTVDLSELVLDPEGDDVVVTTTDTVSASPLDRLSVRADDQDTLEVSSTKSEGPGAVTFEVSDRARLTDPQAHTAVISVPVQVGDAVPVINCPGQPLDVPEGGVSKVIDIASVCHVWTAIPADARDLNFTAEWQETVNDVDVSSTDAGIKLVAGADARRGETGTLAIAAKGEKASGRLLVRVVALPAPRLAPIKLDTEAGKPISVNVDNYLSSPLPTSSRETKVLAVTPVEGSARSTVEGAKVTFTPLPDTHGVMRYGIEVSDTGGSATSGRPTAKGEVVLAVVARPDPPTGLSVGSELLSNTVALTWKTPESNGDRIDKYEVSYTGPSSGTFNCPGSPCRVTGLKNGTPYTFKVRAHNGVAANGGFSDWSNTVKGEADDFTGPVQNLRVKLQRDSQVTVAWDAPAACDCSEVQKYRISWPGGGVHDAGAGAREFIAGRVRNGEPVTVTVVPLNHKGIQENRGPVATVSGTGAGKPATPGAPNLAPTDRPGRTAKAIAVSWGPVGANGPDPVSYRVQRSGGGATREVCGWATATSCNDEVANDGTVYTYQVQAKNAEADNPREASAGGSALHVSDWSGGQQIEASARPDGVTISSFQATGTNGQARVVFRVGASHGKTNRVECQVSGSACGPWTVATAGANGDQLITGLSNGNTSTIQLRSCNGGTVDPCSAWVSASTVTYGPIGNVSINSTPDSPATGDRTTNWTIDVNPNGAPVHWTVRSSANGVIAQGTSGNGAFSRSGGETLGYSTSVTYTVSVTDASGHNRAGKQDSNGARTGAAPPPPPPPPPPAATPYLTFSQKPFVCSSSTSASACERGMGTVIAMVTGHAFASASSCTISGDAGYVFTLGNYTHEVYGYSVPGDSYRVVCGNGASGSYTVR